MNKHVLLGVTGGIAAYKSAELVRTLREAGAEVRVVMSAGATAFVAPLTFQALSGNPVATGHLDAAQENAMSHIELARWADAAIVAPASAHFLAKLAHGYADDLLSTLCLCLEVPLAVAPAMNRAMWANGATRENVDRVAARGVHIFGPGIGSQACGEVGPGRMLEPAELAARLAGLFESDMLAGRRVLITAGPTREAIDPVRFIGNRSSGKMGYAIAAAAAAAGARVTLVSGPVTLDPPENVSRVMVESAAEMLSAVMARVRDCDLFIGCAAVADYRPRLVAERKIKKTGAPVGLELEPTTDILATVAALEDRPFTVGFAAETDDLEDNARRKRERKQVDIIAANPVGVEGVGFDSDENSLQLFWEGGDRVLQRTSKVRLARQLIEVVSERLDPVAIDVTTEAEAHAKGSTQDS